MREEKVCAKLLGRNACVVDEILIIEHLRPGTSLDVLSPPLVPCALGPRRPFLFDVHIIKHAVDFVHPIESNK